MNAIDFDCADCGRRLGTLLLERLPLPMQLMVKATAATFAGSGDATGEPGDTKGLPVVCTECRAKQ